MFKNYSLKNKILTILNYTLYALFVVIVGAVILKKDKEVADYAFLLIGSVSFCFGILSEIIKHMNNKALYELNFLMDPDKADETYNKLLKFDIFKIYKKDKGLFDVPVAIERGEYEKALQIIKENDEKFRANIETLLIMYYYQMQAYTALKKREKANLVYSYVRDVEKLKKKPKIFQFDEFHGMHEYNIGNFSRALECFKNVNTRNMNPKERKNILNYLIMLAPDAEKEQYKEELKSLYEYVEKRK